jgi:hypothetical protein
VNGSGESGIDAASRVGLAQYLVLHLGCVLLSA